MTIGYSESMLKKIDLISSDVSNIDMILQNFFYILIIYMSIRFLYFVIYNIFFKDC